ncbi:MAG: hypothetical protein J6W14_02695 [Clostridia bacterium]|nr:hypothetical protein [Clostridia bacterium]
MKGKRVFYCEMAYAVGILVLALGTALMERANFGMSMVVAPAYLLHLKISQFWPFFSFGMAEYVFQALLLGFLALVMRKVKRRYLLSFVTAFVYGMVLDGVMALVGLLPWSGIAWQIVFYAAGMVVCAIGVALLFHTYFPPEAYELVVKELSEKWHMSIGMTKTIYDCCSCALGVVLSLGFFGTFVGVQWGTVICAIINGWLIGRISRCLENIFDFRDAFPLREKF